MKFTFQGVDYWIEFQYDTITQKKTVKNFTTCRIVTGPVENQTTVGEAKIARFHKDRFEKESARQFALMAAIQSGNAIFPCIDDRRGFRRAARTAYHRREGGLDYARAVRKGMIEARIKPQTITATK